MNDAQSIIETWSLGAVPGEGSADGLSDGFDSLISLDFEAFVSGFSADLTGNLLSSLADANDELAILTPDVGIASWSSSSAYDDSVLDGSGPSAKDAQPVEPSTAAAEPASLIADLMPSTRPMIIDGGEDAKLIAPEADEGGGQEIGEGDVGGDGFVDETGSGDDSVSGYWLASAGDVNGDGLDDLIVTSYAIAGEVFSSSVHVVFATPDGSPSAGDVSNIDGSNGFRIDGATSEGGGTSAAPAGDVNGDGFADLVVSTYGSGASGKSYIVFGAAGGFPAALDVATLDGSNGFAITGLEGDEYSSWCVNAGEDVNGDGFADLIVSTWQGASDGSYSASSYVVFGHAGGFDAAIDIAALDGTNGYELPPEDPVDPGEDGGGEVIVDDGIVYDYPPEEDYVLLGEPVSFDIAIEDDIATVCLALPPAIVGDDAVL